MYNSKNLNPYIYCYQNPVIYEDPNGKQNYSLILGGLERLISNTAAAGLGSAHATGSAYSVGLADLVRLTEPPKTFSRSELISYYAGRAIADIAMIIQGGNIANTGGTMALATGLETGGGGAVVGAGVAIYGGGVGLTGTVDLGQSLASLMSLGADPSKGTGSSSNTSTQPEYKTAKPGVSGKEGAKDVPSWAKGNKPFLWCESGL